MLSIEPVAVLPSSALCAKPRLPLRRSFGGARLGRPPRRPVRILDLDAAAYPRQPAVAAARNGALATNSLPQSNGLYTVSDFMTKKENLIVVKVATSVDEALEMLVKNRITAFPVIDDEWNLVGVVSDYDLLALDSILGSGLTGTCMFPDVESSWKTFNEIQKLLSKTNGRVIGEVMTPAPLVVRETTNLEDAARLLLETKYHRFPVVDADNKLVGLITRGTVVRAALQIKHENKRRPQA